MHRQEKLPVIVWTHLSDMWLSTLEMGRCSLVSSQKSRRYNSFDVWTEAQSEMILVAAQKPSDIV